MTTTKHMHEIQRWEDVPVFATEDDERAYWYTHTLSEELLAEMSVGPGDPQLAAPRGHGRTQPISVRLDPELLQRVKAIARARNVRYQTLLKQWIAERLAVEESPTGGESPTRLGMVSPEAVASIRQAREALATALIGGLITFDEVVGETFGHPTAHGDFPDDLKQDPIGWLIDRRRKT